MGEGEMFQLVSDRSCQDQVSAALIPLLSAIWPSVGHLIPPKLWFDNSMKALEPQNGPQKMAPAAVCGSGLTTTHTG